MAFNGVINSDIKLNNYICIEKSILKKNFIEKFNDDKLFYGNNDIFICLDGVVLNFKTLRNKYSCKSNFLVIDKLFKSQGIAFLKELRGNYCGYIIDRKNGKYYIFNNHLGTKFLYYSYSNNTLFFGTDLREIVFAMKNNGEKIKLSYEGSYFMLTYGYMLEDFTLVENIKKLESGTYIEFDLSKIKKVNYFKIDNTDIINDNEEKIISNMNELFEESIKLSFNKDLEYGYNHICQMSGGMDSRMIAFYAKKLGYDNITLLNFSQMGYLDEKISRQIAKYLESQLIFRSLDGGNYLKSADKVISLNGGQMIYSGGAHTATTNELINWDKFGMLHNGGIADLMHGDYVEAPFHTSPSVETWAYSSELMDKIKKINNEIVDKYPNQELFAINNRGINGMLNGNIITQNFTETSEPYLLPEIIEYSSRIDPKYKYKEKAFIKMINKYVPEATKFKWEKYNKRPTEFNMKLLENPIYSFCYRGKRAIKRKINQGNGKNSMNPFDYWYENNNSLRAYVNNYFEENIKYIESNRDLLEDCEHMMMNGSFLEKSQVISLLAAIKYILGE